MPTPIFHVRLPVADRANLERVAKLYGTPASTFVRDFIVAMCSDSEAKRGAFMDRFVEKMTGQTSLALQIQELDSSNAEVIAEHFKRNSKPAMRRKRRTKGGRRAKRTG